MLKPAPVEIELGQRAYWLIQLRWIASSAIIYGTLMATSVLGLRLDPVPLYLIGAAVAMYNSLYIIGLKWSEARPRQKHLWSVRLLTDGQIVTDLISLTLLIHFTGGVENPLAFYFIFHVVIASILLSRLETFVQATVACVLYGGLIFGEFMQVIPHVHLLGPAGYDLAGDFQFVAIYFAVFASTLYLSAYMATSIVARLPRRDLDMLSLSAELERKAQELEDACGNLAELEQMKSENLRKISHEIKPPLAAIQGWLNGVLDGVLGEVPARQREVIVRAERRTRELLALVSDMLVLSKARDARLFTEREPVNLAKIAERVAAAAATRAAAVGISLSTRLNPDTPPVSGDATALEQLITHLVSNAVNYTPNGGKIEISVDSIGDVVRLQVADTGIGIPSADLPRIFNEFFRSENARRYSEEGTGLGLSIARSIVESHGGEIEATSQVGKGSTFTVTLPVDQRSQILA